MTIVVRLATADELPALLALRTDVFTGEQGVDPALDRDGRDQGAVQAVAIENGTLVGTGRLTGENGGPARIGRMAVRAERRGEGIGGRLLRALEQAAVLAGHPAVELHAQSHAAGFYEAAGYTRIGAEFTEAGIPHVAMRRELPVLRAVRDDDGERLAAIIEGAFAEYEGCVLDIDGEEPWLRAPATAYAAKRGRMWVAELAGVVVACVGMRPAGAPGTVELKNLYVAGVARRRGLGEILTATVERESGAHTVELWTDTRFTDAHRLYERLGYRRRPGTRELHDKSDTVEFPYAKALEPRTRE